MLLAFAGARMELAQTVSRKGTTISRNTVLLIKGTQLSDATEEKG